MLRFSIIGMNIKELEKLAMQFGSVVVLEDEKPAFVVLPFEKYQALQEKENNEGKEILVKHFSRLGGNGSVLAEFAANRQAPEEANAVSNENSEDLERLNKEILALKEEVRLMEEQNSA